MATTKQKQRRKRALAAEAAEKAAAAKKQSAKKSTPVNPHAAAFERWKNGEQLSTLASEANVKRSKLRRAFIQFAGGKPAFKALRAAGAGGTAEPFGGKRATGGRTREQVALDDSKAIQLTPALRKKEGWKDAGWIRTSTGTHPILEGPGGKQYVAASPSERADLVYLHDVAGIPTIRMKLLAESKLAKQVKKEEKLVERGEKAIKATRAKKRAAKKLRKRKAAA